MDADVDMVSGGLSMFKCYRPEAPPDVMVLTSMTMMWAKWWGEGDRARRETRVQIERVSVNSTCVVVIYRRQTGERIEPPSTDKLMCTSRLPAISFAKRVTGDNNYLLFCLDDGGDGHGK